MFELKIIKKIKAELYDSLLNEVKLKLNDLPENFSVQANDVYLKYKELKSIAGLEFFINSISEYLYFTDVLLELEKNKNDFKNYKEYILGEFKKDFGKEDFRFINLETDSIKFDKFKVILSNLSNEQIQNFTSLNEKLIHRTDLEFNFYFKAETDPSVEGVDVKLKKLKTPKNKIKQIIDSRNILKKIWPYGFDLFELLTDKINIVSSKDLVSYSHFNEQGISYINFIDRSLIESIDDLIHENSHHHLNLILKKYKIIKLEFKEEVFYSPWRKELRSIYAILHSVFTFNFGSMLFFEMINNLETVNEYFNGKENSFILSRFLEETYSIQYSILDLEIGIERGYFTNQGVKLINHLKLKNNFHLEYINKIQNLKLNKIHNTKILKLKKELSKARKNYSLDSL